MPDKVSTLRKKHLTAETVELIRRKKIAFRRLRDHRQTHRQTWLRILFQQWRSAYDPCVMPCHELKDINFKVAFAEMKYHSLSLQVGVAVRRDDTTFYTDLAEETGRVARTGFCRIWDAIRPVLPKWRNRRRNNLRCQGPTPEQQIAHYCTLEGGSELSYEDLLKKCHAHQQIQAHDQPLQLSLEQLPSRIDVENRLQRLTPYRAPGIDGLSPQFLKQQGADAAEPIFQLALKMWLTGHEPVQFKGGRLFSISKKAFSRDVSHMRGIMLIDVIGKVMHAIMRQRFLPYVLRWRHPLQLGGFPKCTTLFATHYLKEVHLRAQILQLSFGVLFLDVKSAFHSMIRQLLFGDDVDLPAHLLRLLEDAGCDPSQLQQEISKASQAFLQQVPVHEQRLIKDAHHSTWFCIPGTTSSFETSRGSRPGSPLADIAFNAMMVKVLTKFQELLQTIPALQNGLCHLGLPAPPVTWVDDVAVPIVVTEGRLLEPTIQQVTLAAVDAFLAAGMTLNFKRQKTEVVVDFRGEGASALRHALFVERLGHITLPSRDAPLKCVAIYEHLGTQFSADGSLKHEITHRRSRAIQAHRQVAKSILRNRNVPIEARLKLFESLIIPILLHGAGNWGLLSTRLFNQIHAAIMNWQRSIINNGFWTDSQQTDFELQCHWKLPPLALRLAKARLLYAFHCIQDGPQLLVDFFTANATHPQGWFVALRRAFDWLHSVDAEFFPWNPNTCTVEHIATWLQQNSERGPGRVRRLFKRSVFQLHVVGEAHSLHHRLQSTLSEGGVLFGKAAHSEQVVGSVELHCDWCSKSFDNVQKLRVHQWIAHQIISDERRFVYSDTCLECQRCFWSSARLQQHLRLTRSHRNGCSNE